MWNARQNMFWIRLSKVLVFLVWIIGFAQTHLFFENLPGEQFNALTDEECEDKHYEMEDINCPFFNSTCCWESYHEDKTFKWMISNTTYSKEIIMPDDGDGFLILYFDGNKKQIDTIWSPFFIVPAESISLNLSMYCEGKSEVSLYLQNFGTLAPVLVEEMKCSQQNKWANFPFLELEVDISDYEGNSVKLGLEGSVDREAVLAIRNFKLTIDASMMNESSTVTETTSNEITESVYITGLTNQTEIQTETISQELNQTTTEPTPVNSTSSTVSSMEETMFDNTTLGNESSSTASAPDTTASSIGSKSSNSEQTDEFSSETSTLVTSSNTTGYESTLETIIVNNTVTNDFTEMSTKITKIDDGISTTIINRNATSTSGILSTIKPSGLMPPHVMQMWQVALLCASTIFFAFVLFMALWNCARQITRKRYRWVIRKNFSPDPVFSDEGFEVIQMKVISHKE